MYRNFLKFHAAVTLFYFVVTTLAFCEITTLIVDELPAGLTTAVFSLPNENLVEVSSKGGEFALKPFKISREETAEIIPIRYGQTLEEIEFNKGLTPHNSEPTDTLYYILFDEKGKQKKTGIRTLLPGNKDHIEGNILRVTVKPQQSIAQYIITTRVN